MRNPWTTASSPWRAEPKAPPPPADTTQTTLQGRIDHVRSVSDETGWAVLVVTADQGNGGVAVGSMLGAHAGQRVALHGRWNKHARWGWQFEYDSYTAELPQDAEQAEAYLASGRIRGIGKSTARAIVGHFGDQTLQVLQDDIGRLEEVPGIGPKKRATIAEGWAEMEHQHTVAVALTSVGAPAGLAGAIWDEFGANGASLISENPYALTRAKGVGFVTCDKIAGRLGWEATDPRRLSAGLAHTIETAQGQGHCYLPVEELLTAASALLETTVANCEDAIALAIAEERLVVEDGRAYTTHMHYLERDLADHLDRLASAAVVRPSGPQRDQIEQLLERRSLTDEQQQAVRAVMSHPLSVLTGGPGVGKSHTIATIVAAAERCRWKVAMCAPTGRAAQRMSELAEGAPAATVHRLIGLGAGEGGQPRSTPQTPLPVDLVVCDESSMLDVSLARHLVRAIRTGARVLFVGDVDQLPSVGPGSVLSDLIASGRAQVTALTTIFRQGERSGIVQVAHTVNAGTVPSFEGWDDVHLWGTDHPDMAAAYVEAMVCEHLPRVGVAADQVQVLTPKRGGSCGVAALNRRLQARLNPERGRQYVLTLGQESVAFRPGDRAMVIRNNYDKGAEGIFNGTPVTVVEVDPEPGKEKPAVIVQTEEGETVPYLASEVKELTLAYAVTIHKSQGSQYPCVVMPMTMQAYPMLVRNLLYTAITRARQRVVLVGDRRAIAKAVTTADANERNTALDQRLSAA